MKKKNMDECRIDMCHMQSLDMKFYLHALGSFNHVSTHWAYGTWLLDSTIKKGQKLFTKKNPCFEKLQRKVESNYDGFKIAIECPYESPKLWQDLT